MDATALHKACEQFVYDNEWKKAMHCGPPEDWEIKLGPDDHRFAAVFTRPDENIRVQLRGVDKYYVEIAGEASELPDGGWIARKKDGANHLVEGYAKMCLIARNAKHERAPEFVEKENTEKGENYIYEWGMKEYNVTVERNT